MNELNRFWLLTVKITFVLAATEKALEGGSDGISGCGSAERGEQDTPGGGQSSSRILVQNIGFVATKYFERILDIGNKESEMAGARARGENSDSRERCRQTTEE